MASALWNLVMAGNNGVDIPHNAAGASLQAVTLALGQLLLLVGFGGVTIYLLASGKPIDGQLWTLDVALAGFYMGQRINLVKP